MNSVNIIKNSNLCCSCGICKNVCPVSAITYQREKGMYVPSIGENCINCGKCLDICPSRSHKYVGCTIDEAMFGNVISSINAWSRNEELRFVSASSGVVTTIINTLLDKNLYDCVFTLDTYDYKKQVCTNKYDKLTYKTDIAKSQSFTKSRYLPVSHEHLIEYIINNREKKVIIVAVSCAVRGILNVIDKYKLNRENYLIIGLFCDQVFNYNIYDYFSDSRFTDGKNLSLIHFKNKESGGWPGNIKLFFDDGSSKYIDKNERVKAKSYFMPERCLYCIDKINVLSDISVGDNYTDQNSTQLGSNSVVIRTELGKRAFEISKEFLKYEDVDIQKIADAQYFDGRKVNYCFAKIKSENIDNKEIQMNSELDTDLKYKNFLKEYKNKLECIRLGEIYPNQKELLITRINTPVVIKKASFLSRVKGFVKRRTHNEG